MTPLERGQLWVMRIHGAIAALVLVAIGIVAELVLRANVPEVPRGIVLLPLLVPALWLAFVAPGRRFRAWGYALGDEELEVQRGVMIQVHTHVPLGRVQHIDIAQGPLERACRVCRLVVHTAGTLHSQVVLPGLARATAEAIRDEIRARIRREEP
ncbi:MAG TPA: PH domain-containing protein [Allosphingosinicella sp.]|jgi:hypothetical protein